MSYGVWTVAWKELNVARQGGGRGRLGVIAFLVIFGIVARTSLLTGQHPVLHAAGRAGGGRLQPAGP